MLGRVKKMLYFKICLLFFIVTNFELAKCSGVAPWVSLNDGNKIPSFGFGTWLGFEGKGETDTLVEAKGDDVEKAVLWAIDAGYRLIDTAAIYNTEDQIGRAIEKKLKEGFIKREDLFIVTKLWNDRHEKEDVIPALQESLKKLNLDYVDLFIIHFPISLAKNGTLSEVDYIETWEGMIRAKKEGLAHSIGVSNFNQQQLERLIEVTNTKPAVLQVEVNLNIQQTELRAYCKKNDIVVMGYTPFGSLFKKKAKKDAPPPRVDDPEMVAIAQAYNKTVPQVALRYLFENSVVAIPKSVTQARIQHNIDIFDYQLSNEHKETLKSFDKHYRTIDVKFWQNSKYYPFEKTV